MLELGLARDAQARDRDLERRPDGGVEVGERGGEHVGGHAQLRGSHPVEALAGVEDRLGASRADVLADGTHRVERLVDVELGARHGMAVDPLPLVGFRGQLAQIKTSEHAGKSTEPAA